MPSRVWKILLGVAVLGFIISFPPLLSYLATQPPIYVFALLVAILFVFFLWVGVAIFPGKFRLRHAFGFLVIFFAMSIVLGWMDNPILSPQVTGVETTGVESGPAETLATYFWMLFTTDLYALIVLVYIVTPVLLLLLALWLLRPKTFEKFFAAAVG